MGGLKTTSCSTIESDISRLLLFAGANFRRICEVILNPKTIIISSITGKNVTKTTVVYFIIML